MASQNQHKLDFLLNAQLNGGFSAAFTKAQQEFARLGTEINGLKKIQSDISSYQKQQAAVQKTEDKLRNLTRQQELVKEQMKTASAEALPGLEREYLNLDQRIGNTVNALERQNQKLTATGARLKEAGVDTANLSETSRALKDTLEKLEAEQKKAAEGAQTLGEKMSAGFNAAGAAIAAAGVTMAVREVTEAFASCVASAGDFEAAMSTVEALSQANAQDMAALSAEAKELGATTKFTARESAGAMGYMAMAGWDAADMLQGMNGVLQLAAASGEDLAMVSDIVTDSLSAFGLTAADTAHFSDVLAAAATNSNTNVAIMGETFKMSASVAGALGYSIEDVATAMGLMANSGVKGSIAGTALRNTFNGLLEGVTLTGRAFGEYEYSAVRADGTMKSFGSTIDELRSYFQQMTEAERVSNAQAIAGQRGYNGLLAILNATNEDYISLTNSINNCTGAAERMAKVKLDNLNGQLTLMNSAWDALKTTIGEQFLPELRGAAEAGTEVLAGIDAFVQEHPAAVKGVMAFTGVMGTAAVAVTGVNAALKIFQALNVAALFTNPVFLAAGAVGALTAAVVGVTTALDDGVPSMKELTQAAQDMNGTLEESAASYNKTVTAVQAAANVADSYIDKLEEMGDYTRLSKTEQEQYHSTLALLAQLVPELAGSIDLENNAIEGGTAALRANTEAWKQNAMAQAYQDRLTAIYAAQAEVLIEAEENSIGYSRAQNDLNIATQKYADTAAKMRTLYAQAEEAAAAYNAEHVAGKNAAAFLTEEYYALERSLSGIALEQKAAQHAMDNYTLAMEAGAETVASAQAEIDLAAEAVRNLTGAVDEQSGILPELSGAFDPVRSQLDNLAAAYQETYDAALKSMQGQFELWEKASAAVPISAASVNEALKSQAEYWQEYNQNLQTILSNAGDIAGLDEMLKALEPGSKDTVNFVAGLAQASTKDRKALEDMVANWQEAKRQQEAAAGSFSDYASGLSSTMEELQEELVQSVEDMDLSAEAAESARSTIQAYIDQAEKMKGPLRSAFRELWQAALDTVPAAVSVPAAVPASEAAVPVVATEDNSGLSKSRRSQMRGFASGTDNAPPGWAWVGEEGPELMRMRGGETVLPAKASQEAAKEYAVFAAAAEERSGDGNAPAAAVSANAETWELPAASVLPVVSVPSVISIPSAASAPSVVSIPSTGFAETAGGGAAPAEAGLLWPDLREWGPGSAIERPAVLSQEAAAEPLQALPVMAQGAPNAFHVQFSVVVEGSAAPEAAESIRDYVESDRFRERIEEVVEAAQAEAKRRAY